MWSSRQTGSRRIGSRRIEDTPHTHTHTHSLINIIVTLMTILTSKSWAWIGFNWCPQRSWGAGRLLQWSTGYWIHSCLVLERDVLSRCMIGRTKGRSRQASNGLLRILWLDAGVLFTLSSSLRRSHRYGRWRTVRGRQQIARNWFVTVEGPYSGSLDRYRCHLNFSFSSLYTYTCFQVIACDVTFWTLP